MASEKYTCNLLSLDQGQEDGKFQAMVRLPQISPDRFKLSGWCYMSATVSQSWGTGLGNQ